MSWDYRRARWKNKDFWGIKDGKNDRGIFIDNFKELSAPDLAVDCK